VVETRALPPLSRDLLQQALANFPRRYSQVPPMHSALKQDGKPLYEYARAGITRERIARLITIHELTLIDWQAPDLTFDVRCTKGAYIRVLGDDLAAQLGTIGYLRALRRLSVAPFATAPVWSFEVLESQSPARLRQNLLPVDAALGAWRRLEVSQADVTAIRQGKSIPLEGESPGTVRIYAAGLGFIGLGEIETAGRLVPLRLISSDANRA
jgi:tRNA pseudouridine55 synthase